jgi:hypothetical protein
MSDSRRHSAGKGDKYRQVDMKKYRENYAKIFGKKDKNGNNDSKTEDRRRNNQ